MARPVGLIASRGIELLTWGTPNGFRANIVLEELKAAYDLSFTVQGIDISKNIQKEAWYVALTPIRRIPLIVDHDNNDLAVIEGNAILSYLTRKYDVENKFSFFPTDDDYTRVESWIGWQHGGLGPMQGQANHFVKYAEERVPYGVDRYVSESERLYGILDKQLEHRDFVVGPERGRYSIADISLIGWVKSASVAGIDLSKYPHVQRWLASCLARPAVQQALSYP